MSVLEWGAGAASALWTEALNQLWALPERSWTFWLGLFAIYAIIQLTCLYLQRSNRSLPEDETESETDSLETAATAESASSSAQSLKHKSSAVRHRFRKRDKIAYYVNKSLNKINSMVTEEEGALGARSGRRAERILPRLNRWLRQHPTPSPGRPLKAIPPKALLEELPFATLPETGLEVFLLFRSLRVFGHLEDQKLWDIVEGNWSVVELSMGQELFRPAEPDEYIYIVSRGIVSLLLHHEGREYELKQVGEGESLLSLLSVLDVLTGHEGVYKTVAAKALLPSTVIKLSVRRFRDHFDSHPEEWVQVIQMIVLRLLHVTVTTLHNYLGLTKELSKLYLREKEERPSTRRRHASGGQQLPPPGLRHFSLEEDSSSAGTPVNRSASQSLSAGTSGGHSEAYSAAARRGSLGGDPKAAHLHNARQFFLSFFGLPVSDAPLLEGRVKVQELHSGENFMEAGSTSTSLFLVQFGVVALYQANIMEPGKVTLDSVMEAGEVGGGLSLLSGDVSYFDVQCKSNTARIALLEKEDFLALMKERQRIILPVANSVVFRLSPFLRAMDFALDWEACDSGRALFQHSTMPKFLYVVLSGRFRSVAVSEGGERKEDRRLVEEHGKGDMLGLIEVFHKRPHPFDMIAIRYSEVAKIPMGALDFIKLKFPHVLVRMIQLMGQGMSSFQARLSAPVDVPNARNLHTVAILPVSPDVPVTAFSLELTRAMQELKATARFSSATVLAALGPGIFDHADDYRLLTFLNREEDRHEMTVYVCDAEKTVWTERCLRQADSILIVAKGDASPRLGEVEQELREREQKGSEGARAQKELVLLWPEATKSPSRTQEWLDQRSWVTLHHHIRCPERMYKYREASDVLAYYNELAERHRHRPADPRSDFARLSRLLTGNSIGLVLGGGGARGASHIGVLRAMEEFGIPVDCVAGVSIGALIGGLHCDSPGDWRRVHERAAGWFSSMTWWRMALDWSPLSRSSTLSGWHFNQTLRETFEDKSIEDLWLSYFCLSTDITASEMRVHRSGPLWAYARASMSLAGYFPPICDPQDGHLLLDGGYVNNVPADVMRSAGARWVLAVDVGAEDERHFDNYGDYLPGWWTMWAALKPWGKPMRILTMSEIQSRLAYVTCIRQLEIVKKAAYCKYLRPPIAKYGTADFGKFATIFKDGYAYARELFQNWHNEGRIRELLSAPDDDRTKSLGNLPRPPVASPRPLSGGRVMGLTPSSSLTDLAAAVARNNFRVSATEVDRDSDGDTELSDVPEADEDEATELRGGLRLYRPFSVPQDDPPFETINDEDESTQEEEAETSSLPPTI